MALDTRSLQLALVTHAKTLGKFTGGVVAHPPMSAPAKDLAAFLTLVRFRPLPERSGLNTVSGLVQFQVQVLSSTRQQPYDGIDEKIMNSVDRYAASLTGAFTLGGLVEQVDVLGAYSDGLSLELGWTSFDGSPVAFRAATLTVPLVLDDMWTEAN